jgi:endonuclease III
MTKKERFAKVLDFFASSMPAAQTELKYSNVFELIVAVVLSAQCTDKRVNMVTPELFRLMPTAEKMYAAGQDRILELIKSVSYPNSKARYLAGLAKMLAENYGGNVPESTDELEKLPGVGRKTANVVASVYYGAPKIAVDTHVFRVSARLGLTTEAKNPLQAEQQLQAGIPEKLRAVSHHWLILHGRYVCLARKPKCAECGLTGLCKHYAAQLKNKPAE